LTIFQDSPISEWSKSSDLHEMTDIRPINFS